MKKCKALIDIDDIERTKEYKWSSSGKKEYIINGSGIFLHRYIMNCTDDNLVVDHINRNPLDNRKENLRICTKQENARNKRLMPFNSSGFTGVTYNKTSNKYISVITVDNKNIHLGSFDNIDDCIKERLKAEVYYFGEFAPQIELFEQYGIDINGDYKVKEYKQKKQGNYLGVKGIFKGSRNYKNKWKVEFKYNNDRVYLGYFNTLEEAIKAKEEYIKLNS